ncbi:hypothetical protein [Rhodoferax sp. TS-BS-61-7]|uniref:hypothetical protein n=1 Tax=Rhodoferax sp. TS-BS-61-7 TaxID=2094194 RepID=UPI000CF721A4|nr:hypothetical protein [Rhodoferax sp. TS-BS-61-7]PQA75954.1 hypothetical protein C5F53_17990 [Rhodoferax sp. TS-BS-61-7]
MFFTRTAFRSPISNLFCEPGETVWSAAELTLQQTWFLAYFEHFEVPGDTEFACGRTMLFAEFSGVEELIGLGPESGIHLKSVHILTPGHVNGTDTWKMDQIGVVWSGREPDAEYMPMDVFETTSGERYPASFVGNNAVEFQLDAVKFKFTN